MANDRENIQQQEGTAENMGRERTEQFNELSELSLEERMAVADQIGVPVQNMREAVATGTVSSDDDAAEDLNNEMEEDMDEEADQ